MPALQCPICGTFGRIDGGLCCSACGAALQYGEDARLHRVPEALDCRCGQRNPAGHEHCAACGDTLQDRCPRCGMLHPRGRRICARHGLPLDTRTPSRAGLYAMAMLLMALLGGGVSLLATPPATPVVVATTPPPVSQPTGPRIDVVFAIDATGSMADEIGVVKEHVRSMMARIRSGQPAPRVRFGLVAYRDHGDDYVTRVFPLTDDVDRIQEAVQQLVADGGGDTPEAVSEALHAAVHEMAWDPQAARLVFLVGDAAPHAGTPFLAEVQAARKGGIKVHALGCSGITESGESEFREVAAAGGGGFEFLTYRQQVVREDGSAGYVLYQGSSAYEAEAEADWKKGADRLAGEGAAKAVSAPAAAAPSAAMENNLDRVLTESVMDEARARGTSY